MEDWANANTYLGCQISEWAQDDFKLLSSGGELSPAPLSHGHRAFTLTMFNVSAGGAAQFMFGIFLWAFTSVHKIYPTPNDALSVASTTSFADLTAWLA